MGDLITQDKSMLEVIEVSSHLIGTMKQKSCCENVWSELTEEKKTKGKGTCFILKTEYNAYEKETFQNI